MKRFSWLFLISVLVFLTSCQSTNSPDKVAIEFTRLFFTQMAHSKNSDYSNNLNLGVEAIKPFANGICTERVCKKIAQFYEEETYPALRHPEKFFANDDYKIMSKFNEGANMIYRVAAMNLSKEIIGSDKVLFGLKVIVNTDGKTSTVTDYEYGIVYSSPT